MEKVTGFYYFSFDKQGKQLDDEWIPREYEGKWIDEKALKTIVLGYEQRLFGKSIRMMEPVFLIGKMKTICIMVC